MTQDDVQALLASHQDPLSDPALRVPPCGRGAAPPEPPQPPQQQQPQTLQRGPSSRRLAERDSEAVDSKPYMDPLALSALEVGPSRAGWLAGGHDQQWAQHACWHAGLVPGLAVLVRGRGRPTHAARP